MKMIVKIMYGIGIVITLFGLSLTVILLQDLIFGDYLNRRHYEELKKWMIGMRKDYPIR
jgi:hypothetical protein